ncbi:hypothetical protein ABH968_004684 [Lysinibacillus sp. RC79]
MFGVVVISTLCLWVAIYISCKHNRKVNDNGKE